jgi:hypothetical protein
MLPQTNLQLYRAMIDAGASHEALAQVRAAYDLARQLFAGCYRPSHKPFVCHLVGTAGALALWGQRPEMIAAGLLHSAYLFRDFGDGAQGAGGMKRRIVRHRVGAEVDRLVATYTEQNWKASLATFAAATRNGACDRDVMLLKLADLCDDCCDAGPHYAPQKALAFGLPHDADARELAADLAGQLAGPAARSHFAVVLETSARATAPAPLVTRDRSFHEIGGAEPRQRRLRIRLRLPRLGGKRAA